MSTLENRMTEGSVTRHLLKFSIPFLLSNFLQAMYNVSDSLIMSWLGGDNSVSGVVNGGQVTLIVTNLAIGFTVGGTVLISQYFGANKREEISRTMGTMFSILAILSVVLSAIVIFFSASILRLVQVPEAAFDEAQRYLVICMSGTIFVFGYNAVAAVLRGMGDSKNPLLFVLISGIINTLLDIPFVGVFGWGAAGDAASTVIAQALALILAIIYLGKKGFVFEFKLKNFRIDREKLAKLTKIGIPSSVQNLVVGMSFLLMMVMVNGFGVAASGAMGLVGKFNGLAILPAIAMSSSISSMAAQNLGAGHFDRAKKTMHSGILLALPISAVFFLFAFLAPDMVMKILSPDPDVIAFGVEYIRYFAFDYLIVVFTFSINGLLMGAGLTTFTMLNSMLSSIVLRVPIAYLFGVVLDMGLTGIGTAAPVASIGACLVSFIYYRTGAWKRTNLLTANATAWE